MQNATAATGGEGPGKMLASARERLGLSLNKVASQLNLSPQYISALENEQYERLAGPTYVKGYLRAYAMLVNVPVREVLDAYGRQHRVSVTKENTVTLPHEREEKSTLDDNFKLISAVVLLVIVGLVIAWWQDQSSDEIPASKTQSAMPAQDLSGSMQVGSLSQTEEPGMLLSPLSEQTGEDVQAQQGALLQGGDGEQMADVRALDGEQMQVETPTKVESKKPAQPSRPVPTRVRLVLRTTLASWIDIRDAYQNRILYENVSAGREIPIEATAPLQVFIGNPDGVQISYNGKPFDISRHKQGLVARFTLKPETADSMVGN